MSARRVIALEGLPFTGKSTAAGALRSANDAGVVDDYHELLSPDQRAQIATLSDSALDQQRRVEMYRGIDDLRWQQAFTMRTPVVVFDRCFISIAAYRVALRRTFGTTLWQDKEPHAFGDTECDRPVPAEVLFFAVDVDVALARHARLATTIDSRMRDREFLTNLIDAYGDVLDTCGSTIASIDSNQDLDEVDNAVREHVHGTQ